MIKILKGEIMKETKTKCRKLSIRWKILIPVTLVFIMGCVSLCYNVINSYNEELKGVALSKAEAVCNIATHRIDADELQSLKPGDEENEFYIKNRDEMAAIAEDSNLKYIYTLYKNDKGEICYGIDADMSEDKCAIGEVFDSDLTLVNKAFGGEIAKTVDIDSTEDGENLLTVYEPIYNSEGKIVGVMGCDYDATHVLDSRTSIIQMALTVFFFTLLFDAGLMNLIVGKTLKDINSVKNKLYDLVHNEGDLTQKLEMKSGDEMELIANDVNELLAYIREVVVNIAKNANEVDDSSKFIVANVHDSEYKITDITSTMQEMSAAMEETSASLNQITENITQISDAVYSIANNAEIESKTSKKAMETAVQINQEASQERASAKEQSNLLAKSVHEKIELSRAVEKVNTLTEEILNIADQTNLLALNASIEAARAGEAGRGFAVVAGEIGKLAKESSDSAEQIKRVNEEVLGAVNALAKEAEKMILFMESTAMQGYEKLLTTSEDYEQNIGRLNEMMLNFAAQCDELKKSIADVGESIHAVNIAVEESTKGITNVTEASVGLTSDISEVSEQANRNAEISFNLGTEVSKFKF